MCYLRWSQVLVVNSFLLPVRDFFDHYLFHAFYNVLLALGFSNFKFKLIILLDEKSVDNFWHHILVSTTCLLTSLKWGKWKRVKYHNPFIQLLTFQSYHNGVFFIIIFYFISSFKNTKDGLISQVTPPFTHPYIHTPDRWKTSIFQEDEHNVVCLNS